MKNLLFSLNCMIFIDAIVILVTLLNNQNAAFFVIIYWLLNSIKIGIDLFKRAS